MGEEEGDVNGVSWVMKNVMISTSLLWLAQHSIHDGHGRIVIVVIPYSVVWFF